MKRFSWADCKGSRLPVPDLVVGHAGQSRDWRGARQRSRPLRAVDEYRACLHALGSDADELLALGLPSCIRNVAMLKPIRLFLPLLAAVLAPVAAADTHSATDPRIDTLLSQLSKVRDVTEVALSPDGHQLAWVVETS